MACGRTELRIAAEIIPCHSVRRIILPYRFAPVIPDSPKFSRIGVKKGAEIARDKLRGGHFAAAAAEIRKPRRLQLFLSENPEIALISRDDHGSAARHRLKRTSGNADKHIRHGAEAVNIGARAAQGDDSAPRRLVRFFGCGGEPFKIVACPDDHDIQIAVPARKPGRRLAQHKRGGGAVVIDPAYIHRAPVCAVKPEFAHHAGIIRIRRKLLHVDTVYGNVDIVGGCAVFADEVFLYIVRNREGPLAPIRYAPPQGVDGKIEMRRGDKAKIHAPPHE